MSERRWFNPSLPQTLQFATWLLYFNAFFALLDMLSVGLSSGLSYSMLGRLFAVLAVLGSLFGGLGLANEVKRGYYLAIAAAFLPFIVRLVNYAMLDSFARQFVGIGDVIGFRNPIGLLFEVALIGLLLHTQSREYSRIWFR